MTKTKDLQLRPMKRKMEHNISKVIAGNVLSAKKQEDRCKAVSNILKT